MATGNFNFTTLTGTETAGWNSINTLLTSIDSQLNLSNRLVYMGGATPTSGYTIIWDGSNSRWAAGQVGSAAIANNAVELGTKTTGDYVASIVATGSGEVVVTGSGEGAAATVRLADNTALRGAATVATPPTYSNGATGTVGRVADARYVTDALAYATAGNVTLTGDVTVASGVATITPNAVTSAKILDNTIVLGDLATALQAFLVPTGTISAYAGATAPTGYLLCDGSAVSRSTYSALWTALGTTSSPYGQGDGSSTFNTPNLKGRTIIGVGVGSEITGVLGTVQGVKEVTLTSAQSGVPAHTHPINAWATTDGAGAHSHSVSHTDQVYQGTGPGVWPQGNNGVNGYGAGNQGHSVSTDGAHNHTIPATTAQNNTAASASSAHTNIQPSLPLNYIIKI